MAVKRFIVRGVSARTAKDSAMAYINDLPTSSEEEWGIAVTMHQDSKSRDQERLYHELLDEIRLSKKFSFMGRNDWAKEDIKRLLVDAFARLKHAEGQALRYEQRMVPSLDGTGIVALTTSTKDFTVSEAGEFIEYLYAFGTDIGVHWRARPGIDY